MELIEYSFDTPLTAVADPEEALRWACSAFMATPQFQFAGAPTGDRVGQGTLIEVPGTSSIDLCLSLGATLLGEGNYACDDEGTISVVSP